MDTTFERRVIERLREHADNHPPRGIALWLALLLVIVTLMGLLLADCAPTARAKIAARWRNGSNWSNRNRRWLDKK